MIPKIIHYCWFGGNPMPKEALKCIESWKKYCPDYEIIEWNEKNFDINYCDYVREAYEAKKWAFITDVVRLYALVNYGGVYMDSDVEVVKSLDPILNYKAVSGFQSIDWIPTGLMASEKNHPLFRKMLEEYDTEHFIKSDGSLDMTTNCEKITQLCLKQGLVLNGSLQTVSDFTLFPVDYFCAKNVVTGKIEKTENTFTIHHFAGSWTTPRNKFNTKVHQMLIRIFGEQNVDKFRNILKKH